MAEPPPYVVLVDQVDDIEDLRNMAYAAANRVYYGTTEYWEEPRQSGVAFCFMALPSAIAFMAHCARSGIRYKGG
jgi:hypothetical protein